jgi:hypothetical protein
MKVKPIYKDERYIYKSFIELYFSFYLTELQKSGFIEEWWYERDKFDLSEPVKWRYSKQLKKGIVEAEEHILQASSITPDFTVHWANKSNNIFFLDSMNPITNVKIVPFRLGFTTRNIKLLSQELYSFIETKGNSESSTSSSISFPYKCKWCYQKHGVYIQKIKPLQLFQTTFTPDKVCEIEHYKRDCRFGTKNSSKLKYIPKSLQEYLKYRGYESS